MPNETIVFQWGRIQTPTDWILPVLVLTVCVWLVWRLYRQDVREIGAFWKLLLPLLRTGVLLLLFVLYLQPQWRMEREVEQNSQVAVFLDTSLSMGMADDESPERKGVSRYDAMVELLEKTPLLVELNKKHDLTFIAVDAESRRLAVRVKGALSDPALAAPTAATTTDAAVASAGTPETPEAPAQAKAADGTDSAVLQPLEWKTLLVPQGTQSRLCDAMGEWIQTNAQSPLAGVVLMSDGAQNVGGDSKRVCELAKEANLPIYTIGFGSANPVENIRVYEVEAPARVQPQDPFTITALIQGYGLPKGQPKVVRVELVFRPVEGENPPETILDAHDAVLGEDGKIEQVKFEIPPQVEGRFLYSVRVPVGEGEQLTQDNTREFELEVVDRKTKVLVLAGGPTREYQFLLTTLFRDKTMETDVLLQSAHPGIAQDANKILETFPATREELFAYDCLIAVDPNWKALTSMEVDMLDDWISYQGGGLILIAGPVYMGENVGGWIEDPNLTKIRAMYPVEFQKRFSTVRQNTYTAEQPWSLDFSRDGLAADFLRLADTAPESIAAWDEFPGVYGCFPTKGLKASATLLASFSNPQAKQGDEAPVLIATQFYGSGRVLYLGTGEFWRLRAKNPDYFTRFYTQSVRFVSKGRMMQQSNRGRLLLTKEQFFPGDVIEVRATLLDSQMQPLAVPEVTAEAFLPDGKVQGVKLLLDSQQPGAYVGSFSTLHEGTVRLELPIPDSEIRLSRRLEIVLSDLERENPQRNVELLNSLAKTTGGTAFTSAKDPEVLTLPQTIRDKTRTTTVFASVNPEVQRNFLQKVMIAIVALLGLEWFIRRLLRLA